MSSSPDDIRVRLSQIGATEVVDALRRVSSQTDKTARQAKANVGSLNATMGQFKGLIGSLGLGLSVAGLVALGNNALKSADAIGKAAQKTGVAVEDFSALNVTAGLADVSLEQLQGGLGKLTRNMAELADGSKVAQQAFARVGLSADDLKDKGPAEALELVATRLASIDDPVRRAQAGFEIFGKSAQDLMPLLVELADKGLAGARKQAEDLGLLITGDLAAAADQAGDSFDIIKLQAQGLATSFISGLAPSIVQAMGEVSQSVDGDGVKKMQEFGRETGRILRVVIATFQLLGTVVGGILSGLGNQIGAFFATFKALREDGLGAALRVFKDAGEQSDKDSAEFAAKVKAAIAKVVDTANAEAPALVIPVKAKVDPKVLAEIARLQAQIEAQQGKPAADAAAKKALADAEKAAREAAKLSKEKADAEKAAADVRFEIEQRLLELTGKQREAKIAALDAELAKQREVLEAASGGDASGADVAKLEQVRTVEISRIDFEDSIQKAEAALTQLAAQRERIEQDVELGITTQLEGQEQIAALELQRLPILQQLAAAVKAAADATKDPALIAQAEALNLAVGQVAVSVAKAGDSMLQFKEQAGEAITGDLSNWLADGIENAESLGDAFKSLASSIVQSLQRIAAELLAQAIFKSFAGSALGSAIGLGNSGGQVKGLAGGGRTIDATGGGQIRGPGTPTSDSILAVAGGRALRLANTEYIVRGSATTAPGMLSVLEDINTGRLTASQIRARRFAEGGALGETAGVKQDGAKARSAKFAGVLGLEPGLVMKQLETEDFDRFLLRRVQRNQNAFRNIVGG